MSRIQILFLFFVAQFLLKLFNPLLLMAMLPKKNGPMHKNLKSPMKFNLGTIPPLPTPQLLMLPILQRTYM